MSYKNIDLGSLCLTCVLSLAGACIHFLMVYEVLHFGSIVGIAGYTIPFVLVPCIGLRISRVEPFPEASWPDFRINLNIASWVNAVMQVVGWLQFMHYELQPVGGPARSTLTNVRLMLIVAAVAYCLNFELKRTLACVTDTATTSTAKG